MAWKLDSSTSSAYKCCFCCHVRTGALILGLLQLCGHAVILSALVVTLLHPDLATSVMPSKAVLLTSTLAPVLPAGLGNQPESSPPLLYYTKTIERDNLVIGMILTIAMMSICGGLIYGTVKGQPKHLVPFLCIQIFDACVTGITMISHLSSAQDLRKWIEEQKYFSCKQVVLEMDDDRLMLWALIVFVSVMFLKMYLISIVWACYNYLKGEQASGQFIRRYEIHMNNASDDAELLLPPKYEDVILVPVTQPNGAPMPPAYTEH